MDDTAAIPQIASMVNLLDAGTSHLTFDYQEDSVFNRIRNGENESLWVAHPVDVSAESSVRRDCTILVTFAWHDGSVAHRGVVLSPDGFVVSTFTA